MTDQQTERLAAVNKLRLKRWQAQAARTAENKRKASLIHATECSIQGVRVVLHHTPSVHTVATELYTYDLYRTSHYGQDYSRIKRIKANTAITVDRQRVLNRLLMNGHICGHSNRNSGTKVCQSQAIRKGAIKQRGIWHVQRIQCVDCKTVIYILLDCQTITPTYFRGKYSRPIKGHRTISSKKLWNNPLPIVLHAINRK